MTLTEIKTHLRNGLPQDQLVKLAEDIKSNGLRDPATITSDGRMLDGRNRMIACEMVGVKLMTTVYTGNDEISFVISKNLHRRHLPFAELAMIGAELATLKHGGDHKSEYFKVSQETLKHSMTKSAEAVAKELGISRASIMDAKTITKHGTADVVNLFKAGKLCARDAAAYARNTPKENQNPDVAKLKGD